MAKRLRTLLLLLAGVYAFVPSAGARENQWSALESKSEPQKKPLSDARIRALLIEESIASYSGNCPCPYSTARNGSRCGKRSAYSREGGAAPLCYPKDVSDEMVREYREAHADD